MPDPSPSRTHSRTSLGPGGAVEISRVVFGCMEFSPADTSARIRTLHAAFDAGVTSFDTAPLYGFGGSEELLARAIADWRARVQILTKVGLRWDGQHGQVLFEFQAPDGRAVRVRRDSRARSIREEVTRCLRRLGVETIELVQVHHRDPDTPLDDTCAELATLQREGKIRAIGVSNFSAGDLTQGAASLASMSSALDALQLEYNLLDRRAEDQLLPSAAQRRISVLAYSPLAQGMLAGRQLDGAALPADGRRGSPYFRPGNVAVVNAGLQGVLLPLARDRGVSPAQLALAWLLEAGTVAAVVAGARDPAQALANAAACSIGLTADERRRLAGAFTGVDLRHVRPGGLRGAVRRVRSALGHARRVVTRLRR